jgi:hypothetical protein
VERALHRALGSVPERPLGRKTGDPDPGFGAHNRLKAIAGNLAEARFPVFRTLRRSACLPAFNHQAPSQKTNQCNFFRTQVESF